MSSFDRWQQTQRKRIVANQKLNAKFVINGYPTTLLTCKMPSGEIKSLTASVVNKQEKDLAYIYTNLCDNLCSGALCSAKNLVWIIAEEIVIIKDVGFKKFAAYLCNVQIDDNYGFFKGPEKTYINVTMQDNFAILSQQKPVLIMAGEPYQIGDKILIKDRAWLIQEKDNISTEGVTYYSLTTTTMSKEAIESGNIESKNNTNVEITEPATIEGVSYVNYDTDIVVETEDGYFKINDDSVNIKTLSSSSVVFSIPYGLSNEIEVKVKKNGAIITSNYKAVI